MGVEVAIGSAAAVSKVAYPLGTVFENEASSTRNPSFLGALIPSVDRIKYILHNLIITKSLGHSMKIVLDSKNPLHSLSKVTVREMIHFFCPFNSSRIINQSTQRVFQSQDFPGCNPVVMKY